MSLRDLCLVLFIATAPQLTISTLRGEAPLPATPTGVPREPYQQLARTRAGDATLGKQVFENREKAACIKCHTVDGSRTSVGPDLASIGFKYERDRLIESILLPSQMIADGYSATQFVTHQGQTIQGVLQRVTDTMIEIKDAESKPIQLARSDIESQTPATISLMPQDIHATMTPTEFVDLVAYLESLRAIAARNVSAVGYVEEPPVARGAMEFPARFAADVVFDRPVAIVPIPHGVDQFLVAEQSGKGWVVAPGSKRVKREVLDISRQVRVGGATGLLGVAFHPRFPTDPRVFLKYQVSDHGTIVTTIEERRCHVPSIEGMEFVEPRVLLHIVGSTQDHNGGSIAFGPDNQLYIGMGDSGPQRDPEGHGQDLQTLLGKILRINIDAQDPNMPYAIPTDNPLIDHPSARKEIWAWGFREPWRISFDTLTNELWVGDVGQDRYEEVGIVRRGENHGWNVHEGFAAFSDRFAVAGATYVAPVMSYPRQLGVSVTGGYVYRGQQQPQLEGWYLCGDFESRRIWGIQHNDRQLVQCVELGRAPSRVVSFSQQPDGELLVVGYDDGIIRRADLAGVDLAPLHRQIIVSTAEHDPILWRYTHDTPAQDWAQPAFVDDHWSIGPGGFGTAGTPGSVVRTDWNTHDIWLRREFTASKELQRAKQIVLRLHHDEDAEIYINGVVAARAERWTSGYVDIPITAEARAAIQEGRNCLAIHCHQNRGGQYIDVGIVVLNEE